MKKFGKDWSQRVNNLARMEKMRRQDQIKRFFTLLLMTGMPRAGYATENGSIFPG